MFYKGINLTNIIQDTKNFKRWSISERAYELFGKNLDDPKITTIPVTDPETNGWFKLIYHPNHPSELFLLINVNWSDKDWLSVRTLKDRQVNLDNRNDTKSKFVEAGVAEAAYAEQRLADQQRFLQALRDNKGMISRAVKYSQVPMSTYRNWMSTDLQFKESVAEVADAIKDDMEAALLNEAIDEGNVFALKLALEAKAKERGYGKVEVAKEEIKQELDLSLLTLKEQQDLSKLLQKAQPKQLEQQ